MAGGERPLFAYHETTRENLDDRPDDPIVRPAALLAWRAALAVTLAGAAEGDHERKGHKPMYFQILRAQGGGFFTRIRGANHETMFVSEVYNSKASAINAANVVKAGAASAPVYDQT